MPRECSVSKCRIGWPLLVITVVGLTFLPVCWHAFAGFDDSMGLYWNPHMGQPLAQNIGWYWTHSYMHLYTPVVFTVWNVLAVIGKADPNGPLHCSLNPNVFHAASCFVHTANVLLVFVILRRLMKIEFAAALGALLFGLHPLQVESLAWASGLKDLLCAFFCLICLWQYIVSVSPGKRRWNYPVALAALALALLSKPAAVMMPALLAVIDFFLIRRQTRKIAWSILPVVLVAGTAAIVGRAVQPATQTALIEPIWRPFVAADSLAFYLGKLFMPWNLSVAYGRNPQAVKDSGALLWTWIVPIAMAFVIFTLRKNRPWLLAAALFTLLAPLPVLGWIRFDFQRISTVSDHYLYLAMFGPALLVAATVASIFPSPCTQGEGQGGGSSSEVGGHRSDTRAAHGEYPRSKRSALSLTIATLLFLAADSLIQLSYWQDNLTIWQHAVAVSPECPEVHENLAFAYADLGQKYAKEQAREFAIAVKLKPDNVRDHDLLSGALISTGQIDAAIAQMKIAMRLEEAHDRPGTTLPGERLAAYRSLGDLLLAKNRPDEAAQMFRKILKQLPNDPTARTHLEFCIYRLPKQIDAKPILLGSSQF